MSRGTPPRPTNMKFVAISLLLLKDVSMLNFFVLSAKKSNYTRCKRASPQNPIMSRRSLIWMLVAQKCTCDGGSLKIKAIFLVSSNLSMIIWSSIRFTSIVKKQRRTVLRLTREIPENHSRIFWQYLLVNHLLILVLAFCIFLTLKFL